MPGPINNKKRKAQSKDKNKKISREAQPVLRSSAPTAIIPLPSPPSTEPPPYISNKHPIPSPFDDPHNSSYTYIPHSEPSPLKKPFIYDPGNGPRVRDTRAFLASKFFAQPPAWDVPLCAEFAQQEVLEMIRTALPEELALILWYNKSRVTSRICPACQRLYQLGDTLLEHLPTMTHGEDSSIGPPNPRQFCEQEISGLCSPVCFILAAFNYPGAIQSTWGRMGVEMDEYSWNLLNGPGDGMSHSELSQSLGMLVKMTRLHDLGLAQLCFGDEDVLMKSDALAMREGMAGTQQKI